MSRYLKTLVVLVFLLSSNAFADWGEYFPNSTWKLQKEQGSGWKCPTELTLDSREDLVVLRDASKNIVNSFDLSFPSTKCDSKNTYGPFKGTCTSNWYRSSFANEIRQHVCQVDSAGNACDSYNTPSEEAILDVLFDATNAVSLSYTRHFRLDSSPCQIDCTYTVK